ncbi:MAG: radical SAM protein [Thermoplasmata archaeon]|nr:radical SAM protein [Thermoplasmata archaeon]
MKSIVFVQPPSPPTMSVTRDYAGGFGVALQVKRTDYGHGEFSIPYVFLMYSAGILKRQGHRILYVDAQAERLNAEATIDRICGFDPEIVITVLNLPSIYGDSRFLQMLRKRCHTAIFVGIGTTCRVLPHELAGMNSADIFILGEPEYVLPELVKNIEGGQSLNELPGLGMVQNGQFTTTRVSADAVDLNKLPWPPHEDMPITRYRDPHFGREERFFPIWGSRGCPMPCSFYCPYPIGMGATLRLRSVEDVVREMEYLHHEYGTTAFTFRDQLFSSKSDRAERICDLIMERDLKIQWLCETRFDLVSERLLKKMKQAGCSRVHFGLETGDPDLLRKVGKPGMKISTVRTSIRLAKEAGVSPLTHIILGLPGENRSTIRRTLKTLRQLGNVDISINLATPYPGTRLYQYAQDHGLLETEDWSRFTSFSGVMGSESMSASELGESRLFLMKNYMGMRASLERLIHFAKNGLNVEELLRSSTIAVEVASRFPKVLPLLAAQKHHLHGEQKENI